MRFKNLDQIQNFACFLISLKFSEFHHTICSRNNRRRHNMLTNRVRARARSRNVHHNHRSKYFVTYFDNCFSIFELVYFIIDFAEV